MSIDDNSEEQEEKTCSNTGHEKVYCVCYDCTPGTFSISDFFTDCRNIEEVSQRAYRLLTYLEYLESGGFEVEVQGHGE